MNFTSDKENINYIQSILNYFSEFIIIKTKDNNFLNTEKIVTSLEDYDFLKDDIVLIKESKFIKKVKVRNIFDFLKIYINSTITADEVTFSSPTIQMSFLARIVKVENVLNIDSLIIFENNQVINKYRDRFLKANKKVTFIKNNDYLTKLPNRNNLIKTISSTKKQSLILINIDDFKQINNFYGHLSGDKILIDFSRELQKIIDDTEHILFKLPGDEFAIIINNCTDIEKIKFIVNEIKTKIRAKKFILAKDDVRLSISIGVSCEKEELFETAEIALKTARFNKKDVVFFNKEITLKEDFKNNIKWMSKLKNAIENDNIFPYFQGILNNTTNEITKYECLVRLKDEDGVVVNPVFFLNIAKKTKLYSEITKIVIQKSFEKFANNNFEFSINLSIEDFQNKEIKQYIIEKLIEFNVGERVIFEILESEGVIDYQSMIDFIEELRIYKVKIAIDDFGSGYSNFEHLLNLNADYLKIDGSLIKNLSINKDNEILLETIIIFAKKMGMKTVAEFVATKEIDEKVKKLGFDYSQGFFHHIPNKDLIEK